MTSKRRGLVEKVREHICKPYGMILIHCETMLEHRQRLTIAFFTFTHTQYINSLYDATMLHFKDRLLSSVPAADKKRSNYCRYFNRYKWHVLANGLYRRRRENASISNKWWPPTYFQVDLFKKKEKFGQCLLTPEMNTLKYRPKYRFNSRKKSQIPLFGSI